MGSSRSQRILITLNIVVLFLSAIVSIYALNERQKAQVVIEWSTASELETTGFNLYRSESKDGEFTKINSEIIPSSIDPLVGGEYTFKDGDVKPGYTYFYELEEVEIGGGNNRHGPIEVEAVAGGTGEFILAATLAAVSALGLLSLKAPRNSNKNVE